MIYRSSKVLDYPQDATLTDILLNFNFNNTPPEKPAIIDGPSGNVVFTYESLRLAVRSFASHLQNRLGVQPGDVVAILSTTKVQLPPTQQKTQQLCNVRVSALLPHCSPRNLGSRGRRLRVQSALSAQGRHIHIQ